MPEIELCQTCGIPRFISWVGRWEDNGVISCDFLPGGRGIFIESENINRLFQGIEELLGLPIEHISIESVRRDARAFMEKVLNPQISEAEALARSRKEAEGSEHDEAGERELLEKHREYNLQAITIGRVFGFGDVRLGEEWESGGRYPWRTQIIRNPYSIFSYTGESIGTVEAFEKRDMWGKYEYIGDNTYRITVYPENHPRGLEERLQRGSCDYTLKPGDAVSDRCPKCGVPLPITRYRWDLEEGTISDPDTEMRMVFIPPASVDAILHDLEVELGEEIPEIAIEAQRRSVRSYLARASWARSGPAFKEMIGLRGLGNITTFEMGERSLSVVIENSCMPLLMVGFIQVMAELAFGVEKPPYEWNLADDGDLSILIKA